MSDDATPKPEDIVRAQLNAAAGDLSKMRDEISNGEYSFNVSLWAAVKALAEMQGVTGIHK